MATDEVLVYELATTDELTGRDDVLERALAAQAGPTDSPWFEALPAGCFRWDRGARAGESPTLAGIRSPDTARAAAADFMRRVNAAAAHANGARASGRLAPFPIDTLRPGVTRPMNAVRRELAQLAPEDTADQWLSTWTVWLATTSHNRSLTAPVVGATVELWLRGDGAVTSLSSRARPWRASVSVPAYDWRPAEDHHNGGDGHVDDGHDGPEGGHDAGDEPPLVYLSDPPTEALRYWSPYWLIELEEDDDPEASHHARRFWPACAYTVIPEIVIEDERGEATLRAQVLRPGQTTEVIRHGEEWTVRWAIASLPDFLLGERSVSEATSVSVEAGLYQVGLEVVDNATGACRATTIQLIVPPVDAYDISLDDEPIV